MSKTIKGTGLGKGLSAFFNEDHEGFKNFLKNEESKKNVNSSPDIVHLISLQKLFPGEFQPRKHFSEIALNELATSIRKSGVIQPIIVKKKENTDDEYYIIAGERRWRASTLAGNDTIPCIIREMDDREALEYAIVENIQRKDLTPVEEAEGYKRLIYEFAYNQEELAQYLGKSRSHIANTMRLLGLPDAVKLMLEEGKLSIGHARALLTLKNPVPLAHQIVKKKLSVRETEELVRKANVAPADEEPILETPVFKTKKPLFTPSSPTKDEDILMLEKSISESLGLIVTIEEEKEIGNVVIKFSSLQELDRVLQLLCKQI